MKPALDVRFGQDEIKSRAGLMQEADILIASDTGIQTVIVIMTEMS